MFSTPPAASVNTAEFTTMLFPPSRKVPPALTCTSPRMTPSPTVPAATTVPASTWIGPV